MKRREREKENISKINPLTILCSSPHFFHNLTICKSFSIESTQNLPKYNTKYIIIFTHYNITCTHLIDICHISWIYGAS